jgi:hypothetical protein
MSQNNKKKSIKHILRLSRLLIWMLERNNIKLDVQVFLSLNARKFEHVKNTITELKH